MQINEIFNKKRKKIVATADDEQKLEAAIELIIYNAEKALKALHEYNAANLKAAMDDVAKNEERVYRIMSGK